MSTKALIGIQNKDRSVDWIYQHHDGHTYGVGYNLYFRWNTEELAKELIKSGGLYDTRGTTPVESFHGREEYVYLWRGQQWWYNFRYQNLRQDGTYRSRKITWRKLKCEIANNLEYFKDKGSIKQGTLELARSGKIFG